MMNDLDLRCVGKLLGFPLYIDVSSERIPENRWKKQVLAQKILARLMETPKPKKPEEQPPGQTDIVTELEKLK